MQQSRAIYVAPYRRLALALGLLISLLAGCSAGGAGPTAEPGADGTRDSVDGSGTSQGSEPASELEQVTLAQGSESMGWATVYIARSMGYFEAEGLEVDVVIVGGDPGATAAVESGDAEFGSSTGISQTLSTSAGRPFKVVAPLMFQFGVEWVMSAEKAAELGISAADPLEERLESLQGLKLGTVSVGGGLDLAMRALLSRVGLNPEMDVEITAVEPVPALFNALREGHIDTAISGIPDGTAAVVDGYAVPFVKINEGEVEEWDGLLHTVIFTHDDVISERPEIVAAFVRALERVGRLLEDDPSAAYEALQPFFDRLSPETLLAAWESNQSAYPRSTVIPEESFDVVKALAESLDKPEAADVAFEEVIDDSFGKRAAEQSSGSR